MTLLLTRAEIQHLLNPASAMRALEQVLLEEVEGTASHMPPYGGSAQRLRTPRMVGGGLHQMGRWGLRVGSLAMLWDLNDKSPVAPPVAIMGYAFSSLRVGATMGLAARFLARADARSVGLLGSGMNALDVLRCLCMVRPIDRVEVYSPNPDHRTALAARASTELGVPVTPHDGSDPVIHDMDIIAVATDSKTPVLTFDDVRPGTHVTSMGIVSELDESLYLRADQVVAASREQEIETSAPGPNNPGNADGGQLWRLLQDRRLERDRIIELGAILRGDIAPRNGPTDITVFRESRGGVGDAGLAAYVYEQARQQGIGTEIAFS
jgi:alanine dehydrogenase